MKTLVNMQITKSRLFLIPLLMLAMLTGTASMRAQKTSISESFVIYDSQIGDAGYINMSNYNQLTDKGWSFTNCFALKGSNNWNYMQVGGSNAKGTVTTPALGIYGNATVLIKAQSISSTASSFQVTIAEGTGETSSETYTVAESGTSRPSAILIKNCSPNTRISIEGKGEKFQLISMKVFSIGNAVFYESFDYMVCSRGEFYDGNAANTSLCDNTANITTKQLSADDTKMKQSEGCLNIGSDKESLTIANIPLSAKGNALLQFKAGHINTTQAEFKVTCSSDATLSMANSTSSNTHATSISQECLSIPIREWKDFSFVVTGMSSSTELTIIGTNISLNDILITPIPATLDEHADNSTYIKANAGQMIDVQLGRTLTGDVWCPLCLPFDVTPEVMTATIGSCEVETLQGIDAGVFKFAAVPSGQTVAAGTPFIVRPVTTKVNPTFSEVTVEDAEPQTVTADDTEGYALRGIFSPTELTTDGTNLFLGSNGSLLTLSSEATDRRLGGLRAFFVVPQGTLSARMTTGNAQTGISPATMTSAGAATATYDLTGRRTGGNSRTIIVKQGKKIVGQRNIYK